MQVEDEAIVTEEAVKKKKKKKVKTAAEPAKVDEAQTGGSQAEPKDEEEAPPSGVCSTVRFDSLGLSVITSLDCPHALYVELTSSALARNSQ